MARDNLQTLDAQEQSNILKAVYDTLLTNENIDLLIFDGLDKENPSVGLFSMSGAVYLSQDILGGFKGLVPFTISYRSTPTKDKDKLAMVEYLNNLAKWLTTQNQPTLTDNRVIEKIEQLEVPALINVEGDKGLTYSTYFELTYRKEV